MKFQQKSKAILLLIANLCMIGFGLAQSTNYTLSDVVSISTINNELSESWPTPGTIVIRRSGGLKAVTVPFTISGSATIQTDYQTNAGTSVTIPMGKREVWLQIIPKTDNNPEGDETVRFTLSNAPAYTISGSNFVELTIKDQSVLPNDEEATRFLIQAAFGADPDELADVKSMGFENWIDAQIARPKGYLQDTLIQQNIIPNYETEYNARMTMWHLIMRRRYPAPGVTVPTDILRQRIAYSLLQIFVISQTGDDLAVNSEGVLNYYDKLIDGAFGNFRQLLLDVSLHPCMGLYLSHVDNQKPDPVNNIFPDENYAREIMQLFSIGLWELNQDGTRKLDAFGDPIPTYDNGDISQFARVFTGLTWGGTTWHDFTTNMVVNESAHDTDPKVLLNGMNLTGGRTTMQDINSAIDNLFNHENTGPFIGRLLIQRLVTSNPSPAYISRVAAKFADNGSGVRGDMGAVVKQILLDPEARDLSYTKDPTFGKMREPYLTLLNFAKTFNAQPESGDYHEANLFYEYYLQEPFLSPSVFNFYSPNFRPPGEMTELGKYGPEFQILTAVTALQAPNNLKGSLDYAISRWGTVYPANEMHMMFPEELLIAGDPDALIRKLAVKMTGRALRPRSFQLIRELLNSLPASGQDWQQNRVDAAVYMIGSIAEFNIMK
ncbi:MAG TPA: DUF1800 family protein [Saprospiraceae bacterium]|nr:DUF1800 family protein [Saprospiraceae bacterium]